MNFFKTLIALALATTFLLTGCDTTDVIIDVESIRTFCISQEAANISMEKSESDALGSELCAIYNDIATFKLTYPDNSVRFYTFKVLTNDGFSLKPLSNRTFTAFENGCEFFPKKEDGYPESAFVPRNYSDLFSSDFSHYQKIRFYLPETGSGQVFTNPLFLEAFDKATSKIKILPIERFLTTNEIFLNLEASSSLIEFYDGLSDQAPAQCIVLDLLSQKSNDKLSKIYYPYDLSSIMDTYIESLNEIKEGNQLP